MTESTITKSGRQSLIDLSTLIAEKIKDLPSEKQQEILDFAEFIRNKYDHQQEIKNEAEQKRVAGLHKGKGWISEDFNESLPAEIWES